MEILEDMIKEVKVLQSEIKVLQTKVNLPIQVKVDTGALVSTINGLQQKLDNEIKMRENYFIKLKNFETVAEAFTNKIPKKIEQVFRIELTTLIWITIVTVIIIASGWSWWYFAPVVNDYEKNNLKTENEAIHKKLDYMILKNPNTSANYDRQLK